MDAWLIIVIVVAVAALLALVVLLPRMRAAAAQRKAAQELESRRAQVATEHRREAETHATRAETAERKAAIAAQTAQAERAEAEQLEQGAQLHERGLADDSLIADDERDRFDGVSGTATPNSAPAASDVDLTRDRRSDSAADPPASPRRP